MATATNHPLTIPTLALPPNAIQEGNSNNPLDTGDGRLLDAVFRDGLLWTSTNTACKQKGDTIGRGCLLFIEVMPGVPSVVQDFAFGTAKTYYYYPSVDLDVSDDLITSFTRSSSTEFPSVYVDGRLAGDPAGTLGTPVLIKAGTSSYDSP